jgi:hypothetical protein
MNIQKINPAFHKTLRRSLWEGFAMKRLMRCFLLFCVLALLLCSCSPAVQTQPGAESSGAAVNTLPENEATPAPIVEEPDNDTRDMSVKVAEAIQTYCPEGTFIINTGLEKYSPYAGKSFVDVVAKWTGMSQTENVFDITGTVVHEETHMFQALDFASHYVDGAQFSMMEAIQGLYSSDPEQSLPYSEMMAATIPEALRTTRYQHYVSEGLQTNSNSGGVLGLLRELEAYHQGARATYELYEMLAQRPVRAAEYFDYFIMLNNQSEAFYEMTFFILTYMIHLKDYKPDLYATLLNRTGIWTAFKYNYEAFKALAESVPARNDELSGVLAERGYDAELIGEPFAAQKLRIGGTTRSTGNDVTVLMTQMETPEYTECLQLLLSLG